MVNREPSTPSPTDRMNQVLCVPATDHLPGVPPFGVFIPSPSMPLSSRVGNVTTALRSEAQSWLLRLTSGQATIDDAEAFRCWRDLSTDHAKAFAEMHRLWQLLAPAARAVKQRETPHD